jgi:hypothetical protein
LYGHEIPLNANKYKTYGVNNYFVKKSKNLTNPAKIANMTALQLTVPAAYRNYA